jgi:predicted nucleic acid-binding protein
MIVVSDTSPITALLQIGRIELLSSIYGEVFIPRAVSDEHAHFYVAQDLKDTILREAGEL